MVRRARSYVLDPQTFDKNEWESWTAKEGFIGNVPVLAVYDSYAGTERWELFTTFDQGLKLWGCPIWIQDATISSLRQETVLENLRIESLSLGNGKDFWVNIILMKWDWIIDLTKPAFIGETSIAWLQGKKGPKLVLTPLLDDPSMVVMGYEPVLEEDKVLDLWQVLDMHTAWARELFMPRYHLKLSTKEAKLILYWATPHSKRMAQSTVCSSIKKNTKQPGGLACQHIMMCHCYRFRERWAVQQPIN